MADFSDFIEQIKQVPIVPFIERWVKLKRQGQNFIGLCPFHQEKSPSFSVNGNKGFFYCFGCGTSGSIIDFVMRQDNIDFNQATQKIADLYGIALPDRQDSPLIAPQKRIYAALEAATQFFIKQLQEKSGKKALEYLLRRGLLKASIDHFRLGWADDQRQALQQHLLLQGFDEPVLLEAGLILKSENSAASYDRFRGRVMYPIVDRQQRVVGFGGRILDNPENMPTSSFTAPKYLNSPETSVFHKGQILYGEIFIAKAAREKRQVIVVEGYMDVIALHQAGFQETVAPLGTAINEQQIEKLWQYVDEPIICFDGDQAGLRAASRLIERVLPILKPSKSILMASMPSNYDPDTLIQTHGNAAFQQVLNQARPLDQFIWDVEMAAEKIDTPERWSGFKKRLLDRISTISYKDIGEDYRRRYQMKIADYQQKFSPKAFLKKGKYKQSAGSAETQLRDGEAPRKNPLSIEHADYNKILRVIALLVEKPSLVNSYAEQLSYIQGLLLLSSLAIRIRTFFSDAVDYLINHDISDQHKISDFLHLKGYQDILDDMMRRKQLLLPLPKEIPDSFFDNQFHEALQKLEESLVKFALNLKSAKK
ncbi:MAG: DNA primase [Rhodospirillaceae bacterium]|nr:DNA primase [Rhodospirillaceae bacterium]